MVFLNIFICNVDFFYFCSVFIIEVIGAGTASGSWHLHVILWFCLYLVISLSQPQVVTVGGSSHLRVSL